MILDFVENPQTLLACGAMCHILAERVRYICQNRADRTWEGDFLDIHRLSREVERDQEDERLGFVCSSHFYRLLNVAS